VLSPKEKPQTRQDNEQNQKVKWGSQAHERKEWREGDGGAQVRLEE